MAKPFTSIPSISLAELNRVDSKDGDGRVNTGLRNKLDQAFMEVGFAYLTDLPGIFDEGSDLYIPWDVMIKCCKMLCGPDYRGEKEKMAAAKQVFCKSNQNTYRGYTPPLSSSGFNEEHFDMGPLEDLTAIPVLHEKINLHERNIDPQIDEPGFRAHTKLLYSHMSYLSSMLVLVPDLHFPFGSAMAIEWIENSISTLRFSSYHSLPAKDQKEFIVPEQEDKHLLTLRVLDPSSNFEIQNSKGEWIAVPYKKDTVVVSIGRLANFVGSEYAIRKYRIRPTLKNGAEGTEPVNMMVMSFEPGANCIMKPPLVDTIPGIYYEDWKIQNMIQEWLKRDSSSPLEFKMRDHYLVPSSPDLTEQFGSEAADVSNDLEGVFGLHFDLTKLTWMREKVNQSLAQLNRVDKKKWGIAESEEAAELEAYGMLVDMAIGLQRIPPETAAAMIATGGQTTNRRLTDEELAEKNAYQLAELIKEFELVEVEFLAKKSRQKKQQQEAEEKEWLKQEAMRKHAELEEKAVEEKKLTTKKLDAMWERKGPEPNKAYYRRVVWTPHMDLWSVFD